ncbi:MAG: hypothetical protein GEU26_12830 [Nitrososphaeraceae archaeon]|nr:hypothetical protein [Nitrososphaeraceae archaeon]
MSTEERRRAVAAAIVWDAMQNPGPSISEPTVYDVAKPVYPPTNPTFIQLTGGVNRAALRFDTGNTSIGSKPIEFIFYWKKISIATSGNIVVCIRKASDDTIAATLAEWPVEGATQQVNELRTATVGGVNNYAIVANDLLSIEFPSGIEIAMNLSQANPVGLFTSRSYNGTIWSSTANAIAGKIKTKVTT